MSSRLNHARGMLLSGIFVVWLAAVASIFAFTGDSGKEEPVVVTHWASSHLMTDKLLPAMAAQFNQAGYLTKSGKPVVVEVHDVPPSVQSAFLVSYLDLGIRIPPCGMSEIPVPCDVADPTIVTPSSAHWFVQVNHKVGRDVVDLANARSIVRPFVGIVTYTDMALCLGWPDKKLGYADILALRDDPDGWSSYPCAKAEWGTRPLVSFTDPTTSSTGRSLLLGLYAIAAGKSPEDLTLDDVNDEDVIKYVRNFQNLIDHYQIGTTVLNTKIIQGPRYGHFFVMPENNLIQLYEGANAYIDGIKITAKPIERGSMVMIYPKEGSMPRNNCACILQEDWVTDEHNDAAEQWIDFILEDVQQQTFMAAGLRQGTDHPISGPTAINAKNGLNPKIPEKLINPSLIHPEVAAAIDESWEDVKKPGIVTLVVDTSASMKGPKQLFATDGVVGFLDETAKNNQVGLITFNDSITVTVPVAPIAENRLTIADAVRQAQAQGGSALYDAIKLAIEMTDAIPGEERAIRGVVVLTDGDAITGDTRLHDLVVAVTSGTECTVKEVEDEEGRFRFVDQCTGDIVESKDVAGIRMALETRLPIQIFFIGIGDNVDSELGRILAEATGAEFQVVTEEALAKVIERFGKYF